MSLEQIVIADGQVPGTLCAQCKKNPCCREDDRPSSRQRRIHAAEESMLPRRLWHKYCSKTCAKTTGAYPEKAAAAKQAAHVGMHGAAQAEDVPDPATALMIAAGVMPMESFDLIPLSFNAMCFTILSDNGAIVQGNADHNLASLSQPVAGQNTNPSSSLQAIQLNHIGPGLLSALGGDIPTIDRKPLLVNDSCSILPSRLNLTGYNSFEILGTGFDCGSVIQAVVAKINYRIWAEEHKWKFWNKRKVFMAWKHEGQAARASLDRDYWKLRKLKWRARKERSACQRLWSKTVTRSVRAKDLGRVGRGEYNLQQLWSPYAVVKKQNILIWLKKGSKVHAREQLYVRRKRSSQLEKRAAKHRYSE
jgi:hypothetical protein